MSVPVLRSRRAIAALVVAALVGVVALVAAPRPAVATQVLSVVDGTMVITNGPHVIDLLHNGEPASVEGASLSSGWDIFGSGTSTILGAPITLFTAGSHLQLAAMTFHLPDINPNCLMTLSASRLLNFVGADTYQLLATIGTYSFANCSILITAQWTLIFGASPSSAHLFMQFEIDHVLGPPDEVLAVVVGSEIGMGSIDVVYEGAGASVEGGTLTAPGWEAFGGSDTGVSVSATIGLFTPGTHIALSSVRVTFTGGCQVTMAGPYLVNFVSGTSYHDDSAIGAYSLSGCSPLEAAGIAAFLGASPSTQTLLLALEIDHIEV